MTTLLAAVGLALWVAAPLAGVVLIFHAQAQASFSEDVVVTVHPERPDGEVRIDASLALKWTDELPVVAPSWSGLVQRVSFQEGATISSGDVVMRISNVDRIAYHSDEPFSRPLQYGDSGTEVAALNAFLRSRGYDAPDTDRFGSATRTLLGKFARSIGVPGPQASVFDPAWVVYLPSGAVTVKDPQVTVGEPAPTAGAVLFAARPQLLAANLIQYQDPVTEGDAVLTDQPTPVATMARPDQELYIGTTEYDLTETRDGVAPSMLSDLAQHLDPKARIITVSLNSPTGNDNWTLPTNSLIADQGGRYCLELEDRGKSRVVAITLVSETGGVVIVDGDLSEESEVVVSPQGATSCPSS